MSKYTWEEINHRCEELNKGKITLSNQYGMIFLLNENNEIVLNISKLIKKEDREKYA